MRLKMRKMRRYKLKNGRVTKHERREKIGGNVRG